MTTGVSGPNDWDLLSDKSEGPNGRAWGERTVGVNNASKGPGEGNVWPSRNGKQVPAGPDHIRLSKK